MSTVENSGLFQHLFNLVDIDDTGNGTLGPLLLLKQALIFGVFFLWAIHDRRVRSSIQGFLGHLSLNQLKSQAVYKNAFRCV